jgi:hypothetical protein
MSAAAGSLAAALMSVTAFSVAGVAAGQTVASACVGVSRAARTLG